ncbi:MAG: PQQ-dependent sugar dehydrogenase, partial [Candidatus Binatia bacterium]
MASRRMRARQSAKCWGLAAGSLLLVSMMVGTRAVWAQYPSGPQISKDGIAVVLRDYASQPLSSRTTDTYPPPINFTNQLGRVNFLRSEPANAPRASARFFVNDLNRTLYTLDKTSKTFTPYINFEEVFAKFDNNPGYAGGLVTFAFDPDYADNGKFYTVHTEDPTKSGSAVPTNANLPGLDLSGGYTTTAVINPPAGTVVRQAVLVEWTDTNRNNSTFEGTAREILRVGFNTNIHPLGVLLFNTLAQPGDADDGNLYITMGDGGAGERADATHTIPQRLDTLQGKILRITPDITLRPGDALGANGRYRIPTTGSDPNPFVSLSLAGLKKEVFAYGFRNPHRMSWDPNANKLIVTDIGLHAWEEVNIITKGANYGYAEREGIEQLFVGGANDGKTGSQTNPPTSFPNPDSLTVTGIAAQVTPIYPVAAYSQEDGDAVSSGFVYRGSLLPQLHGKYIFGDISTARLFYSDLTDLIANDDGNRLSLAAVHELQVVFDSPYDVPNQGPVNRRLFDIVAEEYANKGGNAPNNAALPGGGSGHLTDGNDPDGIP